MKTLKPQLGTPLLVLAALLLTGIIIAAQSLRQVPTRDGTPKQPEMQVTRAENNTVLVLTRQGYSRRLTLADIPADFHASTEATFGVTRLSPQEHYLAFTVHAHDDSAGILDLRTNQIALLTTVQHGLIGPNLAWSPDEQFIVFELLPASGLRRVELFALRKRGPVDTLFEETPDNYDPGAKIETIVWDASDKIVSLTIREADGQTRTVQRSVARFQSSVR